MPGVAVIAILGIELVTVSDTLPVSLCVVVGSAAGTEIGTVVTLPTTTEDGNATDSVLELDTEISGELSCTVTTGIGTDDCIGFGLDDTASGTIGTAVITGNVASVEGLADVTTLARSCRLKRSSRSS